MKRILSKALFLYLISISYGCGGDSDATTDRTETVEQTDSLSFASAQDVEDEKALYGSYIVAYRPVDQSPPNSFYFSNAKNESKYYMPLLDEQFLSHPAVKSIQMIGSVDLANKLDLNFKSGFNISPMEFLKLQPKAEVGYVTRVDFHQHESAPELLTQWHKDGRIWFAEPNYISQLSNCSWTPPPGEPTPDTSLFKACQDEYAAKSGFGMQEIYSSIQLQEAFGALTLRTIEQGTNDDQTLLAKKPIIAVLDSGVDVEHPALAGRIWKNLPANIGEAGCANDTFGCNTTTSFKDSLGDGDVSPAGLGKFNEPCGENENCPHGTIVSSIIAGDNTSQDVLGVCPICRVMPIKIVGKISEDSDKLGILDSSILAGFRYISRFDAGSDSAIRVVNASFGKYSRSKAVGVYVDLLFGQRNVLVVAAAGNEDSIRRSYVAAFDKSIAVAAIDHTSGNEKASFSNFGPWVDLAAPGVNIPAAKPGGGTTDTSNTRGTSFAAPIVAGVAGLLVAQNPTITSGELRRWLLDTANPDIYQAGAQIYAPQLAGNSERTPLLGRGRLSAVDAVTRQVNPNQTSTGSDLDRVLSLCGVVHGHQGSSNKALPVVVLLILPILLIAVLSAFSEEWSFRRDL